MSAQYREWRAVRAWDRAEADPIRDGRSPRQVRWWPRSPVCAQPRPGSHLHSWSVLSSDAIGRQDAPTPAYAADPGLRYENRYDRRYDTQIRTRRKLLENQQKSRSVGPIHHPFRISPHVEQAHEREYFVLRARPARRDDAAIVEQLQEAVGDFLRILIRDACHVSGRCGSSSLPRDGASTPSPVLQHIGVLNENQRQDLVVGGTDRLLLHLMSARLVAVEPGVRADLPGERDRWLGGRIECRRHSFRDRVGAAETTDPGRQGIA